MQLCTKAPISQRIVYRHAAKCRVSRHQPHGGAVVQRNIEAGLAGETGVVCDGQCYGVPGGGTAGAVSFNGIGLGAGRSVAKIPEIGQGTTVLVVGVEAGKLDGAGWSHLALTSNNSGTASAFLDSG